MEQREDPQRAPAPFTVHRDDIAPRYARTSPFTRATRAIQQDLFAPKPVWLETVLRKLPGSDFLSVVDVALAFGVSTSKVTEWIEEGRLEATNLNAGTPKKTFWKIPRASAEVLARHISQGI